MEEKQALDMWVIYDHPKDFPDKFVARLWKVTTVETPTNWVYVGDTRKEVEDLLPAGMVFLPRFDGDDSTIIGVWV